MSALGLEVELMSRAIVLGGGGVTGIAWELGVLKGLRDGGVDLTADVIYGTSAGSFAGVAVASGHLDQQFALQHQTVHAEANVRLPRILFARWVWTYLRGRGDAERIGAGFGAIARSRVPLIDSEQRRRTVAARLATTRWPDALRVTALDARTGHLGVFDASDGLPLVDVVMASGAVPGVSPVVRLRGGEWIDGGMVSSTNALLAHGHDQILVIAPLAESHGAVPNVADDVERLRRDALVDLITPDTASTAAMGTNIYDPSRRSGAATMGHRQGIDRAEKLTAWRAT